MLTVRYELPSGESGETELKDDEKWSFGRSGSDEPTDVVSDDPRISRNALTIRDSGPGPVVFRGQRGDAVSVVVASDDGSAEPIAEGTAMLLREGAQRIEMSVDGEPVIAIDVEFDPRLSVKQRQGLADAANVIGEADDASAALD